MYVAISPSYVNSLVKILLLDINHMKTLILNGIGKFHHKSAIILSGIGKFHRKSAIILSGVGK
jgi:hypothetical protein